MLAQYFCDMPYGQTIARRRLNNIHYHYLACLSLTLSISRNKDILTNTWIICPHKVNPTLTEIAPNNLYCITLNHIYKTTFWSTTSIPTGNSYQYDISVKYTAHLRTGKINILTIRVHRMHKPVTFGMTNHSTFN